MSALEALAKPEALRVLKNNVFRASCLFIDFSRSCFDVSFASVSAKRTVHKAVTRYAAHTKKYLKFAIKCSST